MIEPDVLLVALSELSRDARTLNLARALASDGLRVAIHAADIGTDVTLKGAGEPLTVIPWNDPGGRAARRWWSLGRSARRLAVRPRLVIAMDLFALDAARAVARRCGAPLIYDMREFYFALGPLQGKGLRQRLLAWHERRLLGSVDRVIVSGPLDADVVNDRFHLPKPAVVVLNTPPYRDPVTSDLRKRCGVPHDALLAIYQGVVHHGRGLAPMFSAMSLNPRVHLAIVGNGPAEADLRITANDLGIGNRVHWCESVPYDELHALTCGADVGVCLIEPLSMSYEYALPNKLFETMMARIPVLVTDLPALRRHIESHPVGLIVGRTLDAREIADALDAATTEPRRRQMIVACDDIRQLSYESQAAHVVALCREYLV
ncbi:MAG: glycosyltransferase family 4 protein [Candidatus Kapabacteria bacterium]|nr:glycosyltransferase family 4 protein [Candidatus Kapabacteria bacterium]